ncbi:MAG: hypothetical protein MUC33_04420, partial [Desulfobacterales bacterium]|nr:hypothetical protein [Desulfobacterales bacterium]
MSSVTLVSDKRWLLIFLFRSNGIEVNNQDATPFYPLFRSNGIEVNNQDATPFYPILSSGKEFAMGFSPLHPQVLTQPSGDFLTQGLRLLPCLLLVLHLAEFFRRDFRIVS